MAAHYSTSLATARLQAVADLIAGKTIAAATGAGSAGKLVIGDATLNGATGVLATIPLQNPAATVSGRTLTVAGVPLSATATGTGTAAKGELRDNAGNVIVDGLTVGTSGADVIIASTSIAANQTVQLVSATITHP